MRRAYVFPQAAATRSAAQRGRGTFYDALVPGSEAVDR